MRKPMSIMCFIDQELVKEKQWLRAKISTGRFRMNSTHTPLCLPPVSLSLFDAIYTVDLLDTRATEDYTTWLVQLFVSLDAGGGVETPNE